MSKKILIINAHPRKDSFNDAIADNYVKGAKESKHEVKFVNLRDLKFDPIMRTRYRDNELEPDLVEAQELIKWCDHMVLVTPMWWFGVPGLLKGFFDRTITPGFAFKYEKGPTYLTQVSKEPRVEEILEW